MRDRCRGKGFTLIELSIALTFLSLIMVIILGTMRLGAKSWKKGEAGIEKYQRLRIVFELVNQRIKSIYPYEIKEEEKEGIAFKGERELLKFVSCLSTSPQSKGGGLTYNTFFLREQPESEGKSFVFLEEKVLSKDFFSTDNSREEKAAELIPNIKELTFEYYEIEEEGEEEGQWLETWDLEEHKTLPRAIRVSLTYEQEEDAEEGDEEITSIGIPILARGLN